MVGELAGRVALITGGSRGIGRGAAEALAAQGAAVIVHGLDMAEAETVAAEIAAGGAMAVGIGGPIDNATTMAAAVDLARERFGQLDMLVASAGIQRYGDAVSTTPAQWAEVMAVNVTGVYLAAHYALPLIRKSPTGALVIVASVQGHATQNQVLSYTAGKGALHAMTRAMAVDEAAYGVRVNSISPGSVDTPMLRASAAEHCDGTAEGVERVLSEWGTAHALGRIATPAEVGAAIAFLCGPGAAFVTGADLRVDGGLTARLAAPLPGNKQESTA